LREKLGEFQFDDHPDDRDKDLELRSTIYYEEFSYTGEWQVETEVWQGRGACLLSHGAL